MISPARIWLAASLAFWVSTNRVEPVASTRRAVVRAPAARPALAGAAVVAQPPRLAEQRQAMAGPPEAVAARRAAAARRRQTRARPTRRAPLAALEQPEQRRDNRAAQGQPAAAQGQPAAAQAAQPRPERQAPPRARPTWRAQAARASSDSESGCACSTVRTAAKYPGLAAISGLAALCIIAARRRRRAA